MIYIVGSGPAGVAAAMALLGRGHRVTMLDAAIELDAETRALVQKLSAQPHAKWERGEVTRIRQKFAPGAGKPLKYVYDSDFLYRDVDKHIRLDLHNSELFPSLAKGGLSNGWGAALLPYSPDDMTDWPISAADLKAHYEAVFAFLPLAARHDDLAAHFPLFTNSHHALQPSRQATAFMESVNTHRDVLSAAGFVVGQSRLAVRSSNTPRLGDACTYCGMCLHGCPYGVIYASTDTLKSLVLHSNFTYVPDIIVTQAKEIGGVVEVSAYHRLTNAPLSYRAERLFLAAGPVPTTKILLQSLEAFDQPIDLKDSQYFMFPMLRYQRIADVSKEDLYTLAQAFIEIMDRSISAHTVHCQLYTYSDFYLIKFKEMLKAAFPILRAPLSAFIERLLVIQGFLHSDLSARITATLKRSGAYPAPYLELKGVENPQTRPAIKAIVNKFKVHRKQFGAFPVKAQLQVGAPGRGVHVGGAFPMRGAPGRFESDRLGRPSGLHRIHAVDSTCFPSVPATTITLSVMANAHRIATTFADTECS